MFPLSLSLPISNRECIKDPNPTGCSNSPPLSPSLCICPQPSVDPSHEIPSQHLISQFLPVQTHIEKNQTPINNSTTT